MRNSQEVEKILQGVLSDPSSGLRIGHMGGKFVLVCGEGENFETLVHHADFLEFVALCSQYSDYTQGD